MRRTPDGQPQLSEGYFNPVMIPEPRPANEPPGIEDASPEVGGDPDPVTGRPWAYNIDLYWEGGKSFLKRTEIPKSVLDFVDPLEPKPKSTAVRPRRKASTPVTSKDRISPCE